MPILQDFTRQIGAQRDAIRVLLIRYQKLGISRNHRSQQGL